MFSAIGEKLFKLVYLRCSTCIYRDDNLLLHIRGQPAPLTGFLNLLMCEKPRLYRCNKIVITPSPFFHQLMDRLLP